MRCAVYIRVSTTREEQKNSVQNQTLLFREYTTERGWDIIEEYIDIESGTVVKRDNLQCLLEDISKNKFDCILSKEFSRLSRNGALSYTIRDMIMEHNVHLITLDGAINTLTGSYEQFGYFVAHYENEAKRASDRTKTALSTLAKQGYFMGSLAPYGYCIVNKQLIIRKDISPLIVRRIFNEYIEGSGCDKIANGLIQDNIPTHSQLCEKSNSSPLWNGSSIRRILTNRAYIGDLVHGKETTISITCKKRRKITQDKQIVKENTHEPIITTELFYAVQALLEQRKTIRPAPQIRLFSNVLFCMDCGKGMHYRSERKGYICGTYGKRGKSFCTSHVIKEEALRKAVLQDINHLLSTTSATHNIKDLKLLLDKQKKLISQSVRFLKKQHTQVNRENDIAFKKMVKGIISREEYDLFISCEDQNTSLIQSKLEESTLLLEQLSSLTVLETLSSIVDQKTLTELTPSVLNLLVKKIEIGENNNICIHYKFNHTT